VTTKKKKHAIVSQKKLFSVFQ